MDTSLVVAVLTAETGSAGLLERLRQPDAALAVSDWVVAEFSAALSMKLRRGEINAVERDAALDLFGRQVGSAYVILPVERKCFALAARMADQHVTGLRAGDALHLAIVQVLGATLCTLDRQQAEAGAALGIGTYLLPVAR